MIGTVQFEHTEAGFTGMASWPRQYHIEAGGEWVAGSVPAIRNVLLSQGWIVRAAAAEARRGEVTLLDSFDWRLAGQGSVLLRNESGVLSCIPVCSDADPVDPERLESRCREGVAPEPVEPVRLPEDCVDRLAPRVVLRYGSSSWEERLYTLSDENQKTIALLQSVRFQRTPGKTSRRRSLGLVRLVPLRGFTRFVPVVPGRAVDAGTEIATFIAEPAGRRPLDYETSLHLPLHRNHSIAEVHKIVTEHLLAVCAVNIDGIVQRIDPEYLHDFRVSIRRLRSYLKAVPHRADPLVEGDLRSFWDASGRPRDLDVFLLRQRHYTRGAPIAIREEVHQVFAQIARWRDRAYDDLSDRFTGDDFPRLRSGLAGILPDDATESATDLADRLHRKADRAFRRSVDRLIRAYREKGEELSDDRIHDARIKAKKLRYVTEIFSPVLSASQTGKTRSIRRMRKLQNLLGAYNDLVVEEKLFLRILDERPGELERLRAGVAYMLAQVEREKATARHRVMETLGREVQ